MPQKWLFPENQKKRGSSLFASWQRMERIPSANSLCSLSWTNKRQIFSVWAIQSQMEQVHSTVIAAISGTCCMQVTLILISSDHGANIIWVEKCPILILI